MAASVFLRCNGDAGDPGIAKPVRRRVGLPVFALNARRAVRGSDPRRAPGFERHARDEIVRKSIALGVGIESGGLGVGGRGDEKRKE